PNLRFFDYDGDKKIDVMESSGSATRYYVNDGQGSWKLTPGVVNVGRSFSADKMRLIDINGDGLQDAVLVIGGKLQYRKYYGYGKWSSWITTNVPGLENRQLGDKPQFRDINGDGMADMVAFVGTSIVYFVNKNGRDFAAGKELTKFKGVDIPVSSGSTTIRVADMNGNGSRDIVWIDNSGKITYLELFRERPNLLKQISNGIGQRINVDYGSSVYHYLRDQVCTPSSDKGCAGPWKNKMPMAFTVVNVITTWASRQDNPAAQNVPVAAERPQVQRVYYHHGFYDGKEKTFRGFEHVQTLFDDDDSVGPRQDEIKFDVGAKDAYMHGTLLEQTVSNGKGFVFNRLRMEWADCPIALGNVDAAKLQPPVRHLCQRAQEVTIVEGQKEQAQWKLLRTENQYDGFGNITRSAKLGEKDKQGDEKYTQVEYITPQDPNAIDAIWQLRKPKRALRCDAPPQGNSNCAEIQYFYDGQAFEGLPLGQLSKGNMIRVRMRVEPGQDQWRTPMRRKLDQYGNLIEYFDLSGHMRKIEWDAQYKRFAVKEDVKIDQVTLSATTVWDLRYGVVSFSTDYNGHKVFYTYDDFGRITSRSNPGDPPDKPAIRYTYNMKAPLSEIIVEKRSVRAGPYDRKQIACYDGLGRKLSNLQQLNGSNNRFLGLQHVEYNRLNGRARVWNTYEADGTCRFVAPAQVPVTSFFYDGLNRRIRQVQPDKTEIREVYQPLKKITYDEEDNRKDSPFFDTPKTTLFDGLGRVVQETVIPKQGQTIVSRFCSQSGKRWF
ncbi:MAG: toxin TcdB middle/N-terminal domain-containing protein, partial [Myxococcota bacterium]